jgi:hypothetical protein
MNGKFLFGLPATACFLLAISASAVTTTKNVDIVVTHGTSGALTTYTIQNTSNSTWLPNTPYIAGQSFRRGDIIAATNSVKIRDAVSHADLIYQLDEIATRRENGDDGSIRHFVFAFLFPASSPQYTGGGIPAGRTYQIEFVPTGAPYSMPKTHQTLSALCTGNSGGPYHDLKLVLTDVRNQDESMRGPSGRAGALTFDVCANIANTGRDAPRHVAQGPVRDTYIVSGAPAYSDGTKDPLLYVQAYVDLTTLSDGITFGPVRHIFRVDNSWMNVKAGSAGNAGAPGPTGFGDGTIGPAGGGTAGSGHGDPQAISYRPALYDGSSALLDWSWWDASVSSSSNPIVLTGDTNHGCQADLASVGNWTIPASDGNNAWFVGHAVRYSTTGTAPSGMVSGALYFTAPVGAAYSPNGGPPDNYPVVAFETVPYFCYTPGTNYQVAPTTQGSGAQIFSYRIWHPKWKSWYTTDQTTLENWALAGSTSRTTSPLLPAFTSSEQVYWKETGTIPPLRITTTPTDPTPYANQTFTHTAYQPLGRCNVIGGSGVGARPDIGLFNEYMAQAFLVESAATWQRARVFSLCGTNYPWATMLNEATGRIPVLNYGPPGPNHGGTGGSYPILGVPFSTSAGAQVYLIGGSGGGSNQAGVAGELECVPVNDGGNCLVDYLGGDRDGSRNWLNDHFPSFANGMYQFFGSRHYLDQIYLTANRELYDITAGPGFSRQDTTVGGVHYFGLHVECCQTRGAFWSYRDVMLCAAFGADSNPERTYCNDLQTENYWYETAFKAFVDPSGNLSNGIFSPDHYVPIANANFIQVYGGETAFQAYAMLRDPLAQRWLTEFARQYDATCGDSDNVGVSSYFCAPYYMDAAMHDTSQMSAWPYGAVGPTAFNGTDASDYGIDIAGTVFTAGSPNVSEQGGAMIYPPLANGDKIMQMGFNCTSGFCFNSPPQPDELVPGVWYTVTNVNVSADTFQIICPVGHAVTSTCPTPGSSFASFTVGGAPYGGVSDFKYRPITAAQPSTGWAFLGYVPYVQSFVYGLNDLGFNIAQALNTMNARGFADPGPTTTNLNWDPNVTVP